MNLQSTPTRRTRVVAIQGIFALAAAIWAFSAAPAQASHVSCGQVITEDTTLDSDLVGCPHNGIVIGADGITLDLAGHRVEAAADGLGTGVRNVGFGDVTVRDGTVSGFERGIAGDGASNMTAMGLTVSSDNFGIGLDFAAGGRALDNVVNASGGFGIRVASSGEVSRNTVSGGSGNPLFCIGVGNDVLVRGNSATGCGFGLGAGGELGVIEGNRLSGNQTGLIVQGFGHDNRIERNTVVSNTHNGIEIYRGSGNVVVRNEVRDNGNIGIGIDVSQGGRSSSDNVVERNQVSGSWMGIAAEAYSGPNLFTRNESHDNGYAGLSVGGEPGSVVEHNEAFRNGHFGVAVGQGVTVTKNVGNFNGTWGVYGPAAIDGGGNRAKGNGDPRQCFGVVCR